ncbi:ATP-dependent RNA helicase RhlE [Desulfosarcina alkanivorans]|uniref:DEAD-box ATP-dependent RNA helicase RhpA n=1 Tax=Desulfosarcina alkanivorans TaxID=571177 RepID=A0A5K7YRM9_9BACT|nr:DEAD/DEAH box helicase [Desulfosarcina alkanivorans]BBO71358.1 ATP-dependent RNA helicase RhlE [Desulfosarcina alkanivorans]
MNFNSFSFHPAVVKGVAEAGYETPTPIQSKAIPEVLKGRDVMGLAQTGTGKTAAFALPILNRLVDGPRGRAAALVVAPTRELAEQIHDAIRALGRHTRLCSAVVYGGVGINPQIQALKRADIVVGCPGRLLDHLGRGTVDLSRLDVLVLDEADQMFDMGFFPDIRRILSHIPAKNRQTLLFSATMPKAIRCLANDVLRNPVTVQIGTTAPAKTVSHAMFPVAPHLKTALLMKLLGRTRTESVLVFTRTKYRAKSLDKKLARAGYRSASLQGNLSQNRRQAAMKGFRSGEFQILVATDIAARGIDVSNVSHVINFDIPATPEAYIHRIGRTGRAQCSGEAFTLVTGEDTAMVKAINRAIGSPVAQRTLPDFDYDAAPQGPGGKKVNSSASRPQARGKRRAPKPRARRRESKGAFAWLAPKTAGGTP